MLDGCTQRRTQKICHGGGGGIWFLSLKMPKARLFFVEPGPCLPGKVSENYTEDSHFLAF